VNATTPKRILFIGSGAPWNGGAGYLVRQNLFLGALARTAELHLAMFDSKPDATPPAYTKSFTPLPSLKRAQPSRLGLLMGDLFDKTPRMFRGMEMSEARSAVAALHPQQFDAVFAYRIDFAQSAGVLSHPRLILDIDDPEHLRWQRRLDTTSTTIDKRTRADVAKLKQFEHTAVAGAKLAFVCQENDRIGWPIRSNVEVVPNCVDVIEKPTRESRGVSAPVSDSQDRAGDGPVLLAEKGEAPIVLFVGNCAGSALSPNVDAVTFFLSAIWPKILQAVPGAEFHLVGAASDSLKKVVATAPRAKLLGFVDNLAEVYARSAVAIAPLRFGTGTRIKILEAFAHACPVVATLVGAEGIEAIPGKEIELAGGGNDFADRCIDLLKNPELAEQIGQGGYALVSRSYDRRVETERLVLRFQNFLQGNSNDEFPRG
jgi:glycosyltransferase involved in cell wall biosynthesis